MNNTKKVIKLLNTLGFEQNPNYVLHFKLDNLLTFEFFMATAQKVLMMRIYTGNILEMPTFLLL